MRKCLLLIGFLSFSIITVQTQNLDNSAIRELVDRYRADMRGPYKYIRWFCEDGSIVLPKESCPEPGGVQRAQYKDEVTALGENQHIFLGQILSKTEKADFWDAPANHSRLKQYQLEKYLRAVDDGWVWRRAQFYRGAIQIEDEENWGVAFFHWLLAKDEVWEKDFFLLRQAVKDIPHQGDHPLAQNIRALSKVIAAEYPAFENLRVKIHGQPELADLQSVKDFREQNSLDIPVATEEKIDELIAAMDLFFVPTDLETLEKALTCLPKSAAITQHIQAFIDHHRFNAFTPDRVSAAADLLWEIRRQGLSLKDGKSRLALLDISNALEEIVFREASAWLTDGPEAMLEKICYLNKGAAGAGFLEIWEYEAQEVAAPSTEQIPLVLLNGYFENSRRCLEWSASMTGAIYQATVDLFGGFEPKAYGFLDDRIRSSILLPLGQSVSQLGDLISQQAGLSNHLMGLDHQSDARGLNPGLAQGELVVVERGTENLKVNDHKIYIFESPPADLKPVAGIATVSAGNRVSHVQLLARNLGIPNAIISQQNFRDLSRFSGRKVFYAVSNKGTILMKPAEEMTAEEQQLFAVKQRNEQRIRVPVNKLQLKVNRIMDLRDLDASHSGKVCGPKAANLGQLKQLFPDQVVEGLVIPFGVFRRHLDQSINGSDQTYWEFLNAIFRQAEAERRKGKEEAEVESFVLEELEEFRNKIKSMPLLPGMVEELQRGFLEVLGDEMGKVPVFLRSDTNMEDLKEFTGAGLNLTLFNVVEADEIWQGIKEVWASPYAERSYQWRQKFLLNPENVFPSILIIPSVDVDFSGVMITKGLTTGKEEDITVAFSRGAGGAVSGQVAESYLLHYAWGNQLLAPAREPHYRRLPESGGTKKMTTTFEQRILSPENLDALRKLAKEMNEVLPTDKGVGTAGPYDIELGFKDDKIWLFQVRPFVENKGAAASEYLESISPEISPDKMVDFKAPL